MNKINSSKLIYQGSLNNRVFYLKTISISSSILLTNSYLYAIQKTGLTGALVGLGCAFTPFVASPFIISWFFKRYITKLYYNYPDDTYTAHFYGLMTNKKQLTFKANQVKVSNLSSIINTFEVGKKPFFLNDEDLVDVESVKLYRKMIGLEERENKHLQKQDS